MTAFVVGLSFIIALVSLVVTFWFVFEWSAKTIGKLGPLAVMTILLALTLAYPVGKMLLEK